VLKVGLSYSDKMDTNDYISYDFQARDIYEEAIETVLTVRDFTQDFDAYAEFEKNVMSAKIQTMEETGASEEGIHIYYRIQSHVMLTFFSEKKCIIHL
jgi:pre-mRNA-splicing factor SYF1